MGAGNTKETKKRKNCTALRKSQRKQQRVAKRQIVVSRLYQRPGNPCCSWSLTRLLFRWETNRVTTTGGKEKKSTRIIAGVTSGVQTVWVHCELEITERRYRLAKEGRRKTRADGTTSKKSRGTSNGWGGMAKLLHYFRFQQLGAIKSEEEKDFERITTWFSSWVYKLRVRSGLDGSCEWKVSNSTPFCYIKTALFFLFWLRNRLIKSPTFYTFTGSWDKFFSPVWNTAINNWVYYQA